MSGLQEAYYIYAIVFMSLILLMVLGVLVAVLVIKSKVNKITSTIEEKINKVSNIAEKSGEIAALATGGVLRRARKALKK